MTTSCVILTQWPSLFKASAIVLRRLGHCCATCSTTCYMNYSITTELCNKIRYNENSAEQKPYVRKTPLQENATINTMWTTYCHEDSFTYIHHGYLVVTRQITNIFLKVYTPHDSRQKISVLLKNQSKLFTDHVHRFG